MALALEYRNRIALAATAALVATIGLIMMPVWVGRATRPVQGSRAQATVAYDHAPLAFEPNVGQADRHASYIASGLGYTLMLTRDSVVLNLARRGVGAAGLGGRIAAATASIALAGANPNPITSPESALPGKVNYLIGNHRSRWHTNISTYGRVRYHAVWPGIDAVFYGNQGRLEYDFDLAPGADPKRIGLALTGMERVRVDRTGALLLTLPGGSVRQLAPRAYQSGRRIAARYVLRGDHVSLSLGTYNHALPLRIDPTLAYSTYLGGSGDDFGNAVAIDGAGAAYVTGSTGSTDFPTGPYRRSGAGPFDGGLRGNTDVFVTKFNPDGRLAYSTYLGGGANEAGTGIAVNALGEAYVTGWTSSDDFFTTDGAYQTSGGDGLGDYDYSDAFVTELDPEGGDVIYSTFLGGHYSIFGCQSCGTGASAIALSSTGYAYVTGSTDVTDFPTTRGAFQRSESGDSAAFVTKLDPAGRRLAYSTYLGGRGKDGFTDGTGIGIDISGDAYVTGNTNSTTFPTTTDAFQRNLAGGTDAFVTRLAEDGSSLWYSTYLGGSSDDGGNAIAVEPRTGDAFVTGYAQSSDFPTTADAFQTSRPDGGAFVTKLAPDGRNLIYSTYLGDATANGIALDDGTSVDPTPAAFVTGYTESADFPVTPGAFQVRNHGQLGESEGNVFMTKLAPSGDALAYSTYLGGSGFGDIGAGIAVDQLLGLVYVAGWTDATDFPTTADAYQRKINGPSLWDAFLAKFSLTPIAVTGKAKIGGPFSAATFGTVNAEGDQARYYFQYGTSAHYGAQTPNQYEDNDAFHAVSATLSTLNPHTTYHYRLVARNSWGTVYGKDALFRTLAAPPDLQTGAASHITSSGATLNGTVNPNGLTTTYHFEYGTTTAYGHTTTATGAGADQSTHSVSTNVSGLRARITYHYRLVATNSAGTTRGRDRTFTTG